jgi:hypothetical protein
MDILSDHGWEREGSPPYGVFVFALGGLLAGLEVWAAGLETVTSLPAIEDLESQRIVFSAATTGAKQGQ